MKKIIVSRFFLMVLAVCLSVGTTWAQERVLTGKVFDGTTSEAMPGASVVIKGTTIGATTDLDGNFQINVSDGQTVVVSFVGYLNEEIVMSGQTSIEVQLTPELTELTEIVVVGYGTQKAKEVTGSVASVKAEDFNNGNIDDPARLIQGKVAGLSIVKPGGDPNADYTIRLRGLSTLGANTEPLVVVDGVQGVPLKSVDPNDIASMDVLKDASAASIYGTKGASGVIIITTKAGKKGTENKPVNVDFSTTFTRSAVAKANDVMTADEFKRFPAAAIIDSTRSTDWMDEITAPAWAQTYNLGASGGTEKATYRITLGYRSADGVVMGTGNDQFLGRAVISQKAFDNKLTLDYNISGSIRNETYAPGEANGFTVKFNPTAPVRDSVGLASDWGGYYQANAFAFYNPVAAIEQSIMDGQKSNFILSGKATYEIIQGLRLSASVSRDQNDALYGTYWSRDSWYTPNGANAEDNHLGTARKEDQKRTIDMFESMLNYEKTIGLLRATALAGYSYQEETYESFWAYGQGFETDAFTYHNLGAASNTNVAQNDLMDSYKDNQKLVGLFGRFTAAYNDEAFLTFNVRRDASTLFGPENEAGTFFGISAGYDFAKRAQLDWLSRAKIRGGYGTTGNLPSGTGYYNDLWAPVDGASYFQGGVYDKVYDAVRASNPDLKWEVKKEKNIGLDFGFLNYKIAGSIEYYSSQSSDFIIYYPVPVPPNIAPNKFINYGDMSNSGLELSVTWNAIKTNDFSYSMDFNFTKYIETTLNEITDVEANSEGKTYIYLGNLGAPYLTGINAIRVEEGGPIGTIVGPVYTGLDTNNVYTYQMKTDSLGNPTNEIDFEQELGNGLPSFQFGWGNSFTYKNFDLNFFFRGVFGHSLVNVNNARYGNPTTVGIQNGMSMASDFLLIDENGDKSLPTGTYRYSSMHVEKADFVSLDNLSVGYTLSLDNSKYLSKVRAYVSGQNLLTFTNYSGTSPEVRYSDGDNPLVPGIDRGDTYFRTRSFTVGLNVTF